MSDSRKIFAAACLLSALAGCGRKMATAPNVGMGDFALNDAEMEGLWGGNAFIGYVTLDNKPAFVIWSDAQWGSMGVTSGVNNPTKTFGTLSYRTSDKGSPREIAFSGDIQSPAKGQITIKGESFDLAKGALFLVAGGGSDLRVKQMNADVSGINPSSHDFALFGKADPEVTAFFSKPAPPK